jgi:hypothetical protein
MANANSQQYQQPLFGWPDPALKNCFIGSASLGVLFLIFVFLAPLPKPKPVSVADVPERLARLILEKPTAKPSRKPGGGGGGGGKTDSPRPGTPGLPAPKSPVTPPAPVARAKTSSAPPRTARPQVAPSQGTVGRQKAQSDVSESLAEVTGSLDKVLNNISQQMPANVKSDVSTSGRSIPTSAGSVGQTAARGGTRTRRSVRTGRTSGQLSTVGGVSGLSSADMLGSSIEGQGVSIGVITDLAVGGGAGGTGSGDGVGGGSGGGSGRGTGTGVGDGIGTGSGGGAGSGSGGGIGSGVGTGRGSGAASSGNPHRSNEALLAVVRRYAPGIQFCYDNELKKNPGLRGKLVVSLTVLASGQVSEAFVVENTLRSGAVVDCVLSQMRGWQFPAIPQGSTSFKTPFVFTPPE